MNRGLAGFAICALWSFFLGSVLHAKALITAENGGKGSQAAMLSANAIEPKGTSTLTNIWAQYGYGVSDRVDAFVIYGNITVFGRSQSYVAIGSNELRPRDRKSPTTIVHLGSWPMIKYSADDWRVMMTNLWFQTVNRQGPRRRW